MLKPHRAWQCFSAQTVWTTVMWTEYSSICILREDRHLKASSC
uniref:Uncharacterized protein n=1 Tax=Anguilla anguilla TaxID=7936 RepID=A0A0E9U267_ANGAN